LIVLAPDERSERTWRMARAGASAWLLATMLVASAASALADAAAGSGAAEAPAGEAAPLDQLARTIGSLKASLSAIRDDLAAMPDPALGPPAPDPPCALPAGAPAATGGALAEQLDGLRARAAAERAGWQNAEVAMTGEVTGLRGRLAAAEAAVAALHEDRETLLRRIRELDAIVQKFDTGEVVGVTAGQGALAPAAVLPASLMQVAPAARAAEALTARKSPPNTPLARARSRLDLEAELALAQLQIAGLSDALEAARLREEGMQAQVATLRSLTDDRIKQFMGRE
jgi:hypothetical protein